MDEVLEMMDKITKRTQKVLDEYKETSSKQISAYDQVLQTDKSTEDHKLKAFMGKALELDRLERLSSQLSLLYVLQIFAFKVKVLEISVCNIDEQLTQSRVFEKGTEIDEIKKNIDALKILVEAQYESMKEIREDQTRNLTYIN